MSKEELKSCPFCGHKPCLTHDRVDLCRNSENGDLITRWRVICPNCGTKKEGGVSEYRFNNDETLSLTEMYTTNPRDGRSEAIKAWNSRKSNTVFDTLNKISQELQNAGFKDASKWIDDKYSL